LSWDPDFLGLHGNNLCQKNYFELCSFYGLKMRSQKSRRRKLILYSEHPDQKSFDFTKLSIGIKSWGTVTEKIISDFLIFIMRSYKRSNIPYIKYFSTYENIFWLWHSWYTFWKIYNFLTNRQKKPPLIYLLYSWYSRDWVTIQKKK
jgi:hypothetical protein